VCIRHTHGDVERARDSGECSVGAACIPSFLLHYIPSYTRFRPQYDVNRAMNLVFVASRVLLPPPEAAMPAPFWGTKATSPAAW